MPTYRFWVALGAVNAALAVAMAATATHAPALQAAAAYLPRAIAMHQFNALGLIAVGLLLRGAGANRWWQAAAVLLSAGLALFSLNLYARALWDFTALHALVPAGGSCFIVGWVLVAVGAWRERGVDAA